MFINKETTYLLTYLLTCPKRMRSPGINGEGELRGQPANPGSPGKMAVKTECVCVCMLYGTLFYPTLIIHLSFSLLPICGKSIFSVDVT